MKKVVGFLIIVVLMASVVQAQKYAFVMIQSPSNAGYDQYYSGMYGLKTWLDQETEWEEVTDDLYFNFNLGAFIEIMVVRDENWYWMTQVFIKESGRINDSLLFVYVGHNALMEMDPDTLMTNCSDNMIFACLSEAYFGYCMDNTLVNTTGFMAPEAYAIYPAIRGMV